MESRETFVPADAETRRAALVYNLRTRLAPVCCDWPGDLFERMVERLADITLKYEGCTSVSTYDRRSADRLLADLKEAVARHEPPLVEEQS